MIKNLLQGTAVPFSPFGLLLKVSSTIQSLPNILLLQLGGFPRQPQALRLQAQHKHIPSPALTLVTQPGWTHCHGWLGGTQRPQGAARACATPGPNGKMLFDL